MLHSYYCRKEICFQLLQLNIKWNGYNTLVVLYLIAFTMSIPM